MATNIAEEFTSIAASFAALIEGLSYIDEDVAMKIAGEFSDKLVKATREVYADMASKVATELAKPTKRKPRRKKVVTTVIRTGQGAPTNGIELEAHVQEENFSAMGTDPLPENTRSFMTSGPVTMDELNSGFEDRLRGGVIDRSSVPPTGRDIPSLAEQPSVEQSVPRIPKRMSDEDADNIPESARR